MRYFSIRRMLFVLAAFLLFGNSAHSEGQSTWDGILARKTIRVGVVQAEPWGFKDPVSGNWTGLVPAYAKAVADALGVKLELIEVTWGSAIPAIQANKIDMVPSMTVTPQRAMAIDYANAPFTYSALAVLGPDDSTITTWEEIDKPEVTFAVTQGASEDVFVSAHLKKAKILRLGSYQEVVAAYKAGSARYAVLYHPALTVLKERAGRGKIIIPRPLIISYGDTVIKREPDKTLRDWLAITNNYFVITGAVQNWYGEFLTSRGIDPNSVPPIQKDALQNAVLQNALPK
jgi:polar amino acid transport system substrate-binding protein